MWNEPIPKWRTARKQHHCQGEGCSQVITSGERYLDRTLRDSTHCHLRYCQECGETVLALASGYHFFNGRNDFPDRYAQRICSAEWKSFRCNIIDQRGNRCERCGKESGSLALHHVHYRSLGSEQPSDVELLCPECHRGADEARSRKFRQKYTDSDDIWVVGPDGDYVGKLDPNAIYIPLKDGRHVPVHIKPKYKP